MAKNTILQRFLKTGYYQSKIPRAVQDILHVKPSTLRPSQKQSSGRRQPKYLKGVGRDGNYYRLKIPPRKKILPNIPKLPKGQNSPKPLTPPPPPPESAADIKGYKRRLLKWLLGNIPILILNFGRYGTQGHHAPLSSKTLINRIVSSQKQKSNNYAPPPLYLNKLVCVHYLPLLGRIYLSFDLFL